MTEPRNRVVQLGRYGDADELEVVDAPLACLCREPPAPSARGCSPSASWPASNSGAQLRGEHAAIVREFGATPIDHKCEDFTTVLPGGFDVSSTVLARAPMEARSRRSSAAACSALMATRRACSRSAPRSPS